MDTIFGRQNPHFLCHIWNANQLAQITDNAILLGYMAACMVSFVDLDGVRHSVEVEAEGLYEASVLASYAFRKHELELGGLTQLEVEVRSSVKHSLTVTKVRDWFERGGGTPKEAALKEACGLCYPEFSTVSAVRLEDQNADLPDRPTAQPLRSGYPTFQSGSRQ